MCVSLSLSIYTRKCVIHFQWISCFCLVFVQHGVDQTDHVKPFFFYIFPISRTWLNKHNQSKYHVTNIQNSWFLLCQRISCVMLCVFHHFVCFLMSLHDIAVCLTGTYFLQIRAVLIVSSVFFYI